VTLTKYLANFTKIDEIDAEPCDGKLKEHFSQNWNSWLKLFFHPTLQFIAFVLFEFSYFSSVWMTDSVVRQHFIVCRNWKSEPIFVVAFEFIELKQNLESSISVPKVFEIRWSQALIVLLQVTEIIRHSANYATIFREKKAQIMPYSVQEGNLIEINWKSALWGLWFSRLFNGLIDSKTSETLCFMVFYRVVELYGNWHSIPLVYRADWFQILKLYCQHSYEVWSTYSVSERNPIRTEWRIFRRIKI